MKARLFWDSYTDGKANVPAGFCPAGTVIDHPDAYRLVQLGSAEPADEECRSRHGLTDEQLAAAKTAQDEARKGIHPEDLEMYRGGVILGYYPDGTYIPGPNWQAVEDEEEEEAFTDV